MSFNVNIRWVGGENRSKFGQRSFWMSQKGYFEQGHAMQLYFNIRERELQSYFWFKLDILLDVLNQFYNLKQS